MNRNRFCMDRLTPYYYDSVMWFVGFFIMLRGDGGCGDVAVVVHGSFCRV